MTALDIALTLGPQGLPVFPCSGNKRPAIPEEAGGRGLHDATSDPEAIRALFTKAGNAAKLVAVPTGSRSGYDVLDIDPRHGGDVWEFEHRHQLPETRIHQTPGGGRHYVIHHHPGVRNSAGRIAPGVDVRGEGGYAIWPPSVGYQVVHDVEPADWPRWLLELIIRTPPPPRPFVPTSPAELTDQRLDGLLRSLLARLSNAPEGAKHDTLLRIARTIGGYAHLLGESDDRLVRLMLGALPGTVKDWRNAEQTARDGLRYGQAAPLDLEERSLPQVVPLRDPETMRRYALGALRNAGERVAFGDLRMLRQELQALARFTRIGALTVAEVAEGLALAALRAGLQEHEVVPAIDAALWAEDVA
jgi:hypothetical protein